MRRRGEITRGADDRLCFDFVAVLSPERTPLQIICQDRRIRLWPCPGNRAARTKRTEAHRPEQNGGEGAPVFAGARNVALVDEPRINRTSSSFDREESIGLVSLESLFESGFPVSRKSSFSVLSPSSNCSRVDTRY